MRLEDQVIEAHEDAARSETMLKVFKWLTDKGQTELAIQLVEETHGEALDADVSSVSRLKQFIPHVSKELEDEIIQLYKLWEDLDWKDHEAVIAYWKRRIRFMHKYLTVLRTASDMLGSDDGSRIR